MMEPDKVIQVLLEEFKAMESDEPSKFDQSTSRWTSTVLTLLCRIGKDQFDYLVYASSNFVDKEYKSGGEWLYDVTWCEYEGDFLKSAPLVAECEWGNLGNIKDDFEKLILARAAVRVFVFDGGYCENGAEALANKFCDWVGAFEGSQKGDTYLLVGYERDEKIWCFRYFNILVDDPGQQPMLQRL